MLCETCVECFEGIHDPLKTRRLALRSANGPSNWQLFLDLKRTYKEPILEIEKYIFGHHKTQLSCNDSHQRGCLVCHSVVVAVEPPIGEHLRYFSVFSVSWWEQKLVISLEWQDKTLSDFTLLPLMGILYPTILRRLLIRSDGPRDFPNLSEYLSPSTDSPHTVQLIQRWLRDCSTNHLECTTARIPLYMPTRLLEIKDTMYHLVHSSSLVSSVEYVSLSHCWGQNDQKSKLELRKETHDQLQRGDTISSLPKTFRDAMELAKILGIRYIWIDRLCIHQDSIADWMAEAATMRNVYGNAIITVAALGADDDNGGLFFDRDTRDIAPTIVNIKKCANSRAIPYMSNNEYTLPWRLHFLDSPLLQRAWVVQERAMSSKVIYFGRKMVFWECWGGSACELNPIHLVDYIAPGLQSGPTEKPRRRKHQIPVWKPLLESRDHGTAMDAYRQVLFEWAQILSVYVKCELSYCTDRLVAMSGLANRFREILQLCKPDLSHRYLAGHWEETLPWSLTWSSAWKATRFKDVAPSWSWASVDRLSIPPTSLVSENDGWDYATYCGGDVELQSREDTGAVKSGWIKLSVPLTRLATVLGDRNSDDSWPIRSIVFKGIDTDQELRIGEENITEGVTRYDSEEQLPAELYGAPIMTHKFEWGPLASILILAEEPKAHVGSYVRVGILQMFLRKEVQAGLLFHRFQHREITIR